MTPSSSGESPANLISSWRFGPPFVARTVLFRRVRSVLIRSHGQGLIANTLNFDYKVRSADEAFSALPSTKSNDETLDPALHIIKKKAGGSTPRSSMIATTRPCSNW
jgi:non-homologous end joining protein Ku